MNEKAELLKQLHIDRTEAQPAGGLKIWQMLVFGALCAAIAWWFGTQQTTISSDIEESVQQFQSVTTPSEPAVATPEKPAQIIEDNTILSASGYITARRMATVSAEIMGLLTEVNVEEGMNVSTGDVLAELDNAVVTVNLQLAQANVAVLNARSAAIEASLEEAQRNYQRILNNEFSSDAEKTRAFSEQQNLTASLESAKADIRVAELQIKQQQEQLENHTIRAPFGGVVTVKNAQPGEIVAPTSAGGGFTRTGICTIVDMSSLEIEVDVNESFIGRVFPGQQVEAILDAYPEWQIPASVIAIIPTADRAKATVQVRIRIERSDERILPDMGVKVNFLKS